MVMEKSWVRRHWWIFFAAPLAIVVLITIGGEVVMHLWNWLAPTLFGWKQVNLWQAIGLLALCRICLEAGAENRTTRVGGGGGNAGRG
jgi:hypothetical protein